MRHLPVSRPFDVRSRHLPGQGRGQRMARARPHPQPRGSHEARQDADRPGHRADRPGSHRPGRRGGQVRRRKPGPGSQGALPGRLCRRGCCLMAVLTMRDALNQALREEMKRDEKVFLLGEDIGLYDGSFKVTRGLMKEFGDKRVLDTPIAEEIIVGTAIGAAMSGLRPVAEMMTVNFIMVAMDQVVNAAAHIRYMFGGGTKVPLVIRTPGGGGHQLGAQHSHSHENWFAHVPGLKVVAPGTPADAKGMLKSAIRDNNPVMFIENEGTYAVKGEVPDGEHLVPLDKNEVKRPGEHITICAHSRMLIVAMDAATELEKEGISAEVVDMRALRPPDMAPVIESVKKTSRLITVEEGWRSYGVGSEIASRVYEEAFDYLDAPVARIGAAEVPAPYNKRLEKIAFPGKADVIITAKALLGKN